MQHVAWAEEFYMVWLHGLILAPLLQAVIRPCLLIGSIPTAVCGWYEVQDTLISYSAPSTGMTNTTKEGGMNCEVMREAYVELGSRIIMW